MRTHKKLYEWLVSYVVYGQQGRQERNIIIKTEHRNLNQQRVEGIYPLLQGNERLDALVILNIIRLGGR